ncbi:MAG: DUF1611 domain-containing protein [Holosporales bacterium]|jgi:hypothetical protein|nr:DUF1611 domain-containing protein [Holosporales bacterium]
MQNCLHYDLILLDSGYAFNNKNGSAVDIFIREADDWRIAEKADDAVGHGTAVMSIIVNGHNCGKYAVFKAFTSTTQSNVDNVLSALRFINEKVSCKYIQMSFGVRGFNRELETICRELYEKGIILIAALDNCGAMSYPASHDFVVGVSGDPFLKTKNDFAVSDSGVVDIYAKSARQIVGKNANGYVVEQGNSFAASYVSLALLESGKSFATKESAMRFFSPGYSTFSPQEKSMLLGTKAALFPLNKEMYSLVNYSEFLAIQLIAIYDIKYSSNLRRTLLSFDGRNEYVVKNIEKCDWVAFDTLILGHMRELSQLLGRDIKRELLEKCISNRKNAYCFDGNLYGEFSEKFRKEGLILECADEYASLYAEGRLYQFKTPILCVLGTNKKQGKFTLQMQIRSVLQQNNVRVGVLGTEPNALLLGCDEVLPLGYDSALAGHFGSKITEAANYAMHKIDVLERDIIITGGQSGFLPHITFNSGHINASQIPFLYGIMPDGIILSFSEGDSSEYLRKSIRAIEGLISTKVFLLALYAFHTEKDYVIDVSKRLLTDKEIASQRKRIKKDLGLEIVVSGDIRDNDLLFKKIIEFYCEPTETEQ